MNVARLKESGTLFIPCTIGLNNFYMREHLWSHPLFLYSLLISVAWFHIARSSPNAFTISEKSLMYKKTYIPCPIIKVSTASRTWIMGYPVANLQNLSIQEWMKKRFLPLFSENEKRMCFYKTKYFSFLISFSK